MTDHIGQSQVVPYLVGLAAMGYRIHVLSAEKKGKDEAVARCRTQLDQAGIEWTHVRYHNSPPLIGTVFDFVRMTWIARRIVKSKPINFLHCRSFPPAVIGYQIFKKFRVPYVFDFRDFYADGGLHNKRFKFVYRYLKRLEGPMIVNAAKVVCLTQRAREVLSDWYCANSGDTTHFSVIPCCADFDHFDPTLVGAEQRQALRARLGIASTSTVLLYLGSLGPDYLLADMIRLFNCVLHQDPTAVFLFLSNNGKSLVEQECAAQGVAAASIRFTSAERAEVPSYISIATLSVVFIRADISKAGCSPTKLAELFACNVPVVANAGVGDLDQIVDPEQNGSILVSDFSERSLSEAVVRILEIQRGSAVNIRRNSTEFALSTGVAKYAAVYADLRAERN
ncbi:MAG: glycosyltransferase [Casimicrobium sp.]